MSETATIASSQSSGERRQAIDLTQSTLPFTRSSNILRLTGAAVADQDDPPALASAPTLTPTESLILGDKFIFSTATTPATAAYHLSTRNTRSGKPWQIQISHLLPSEMRRLSCLPNLSSDAPPSSFTTSATAIDATAAAIAPAASSVPVPFIKYDDDLTLYTGEKLSVPISIGQKPLLCIRGRRRGTLPGSIVVEKTLGLRRAYKFWHMTPIRRPLTQAESERMQALMHRRGYKMSDDWRKELLYTVQIIASKSGSGAGKEAVQTMEWTDDRGELVATERDGQLLMVGPTVEDADKRDLLVACWVSRAFVQSNPADDEGVAAKE